MMTAGLFLALLYTASPRVFYASLPIVTVLCYSFLYYHYGCLAVNYLVRDHVIPAGTIRGLGGMAVGCLLFLANEQLRQIPSGRKKTCALTGLSLLSCAICYFCFFIKVKTPYDFYVVFSAPIILLGAFSGETLCSSFFNRIGQWANRFFGKQFSFGLVSYTCVTVLASPLFVPYDRLSSQTALIVFLTLLSVVSFLGAKAADIFNRRFVYNHI